MMSQPKGLFTSIKVLTATLLGIAQTRLELLANELEEDRLRMIKLIYFSFFMLFFFFLGMVLLTMLIIIFFWDSYRILAISLIALIYLGIAGGLAIYVVRELKGKLRPKLFSASLAEIVKDRIALTTGEDE
jgi:uncharacterized membrane protein YqjE